MGRRERWSTCCETAEGLRKGTWTPEEDKKLFAFVRKHGHENWRALPKLAGLRRCGKSCRLRWINYLRPDVKRGHFTKEEEETIIKLHESLGNKWSKIASCLPGRTDNEVKNVWHTYLKKRVEVRNGAPSTLQKKTRVARSSSLSTSNISFSDQSHSCKASDGNSPSIHQGQESCSISAMESCTTFHIDDGMSSIGQDFFTPIAPGTAIVDDQPELWRFMDENFCHSITPPPPPPPPPEVVPFTMEDQGLLQDLYPLNSATRLDSCTMYPDQLHDYEDMIGNSQGSLIGTPSVSIDDHLELWRFMDEEYCYSMATDPGVSLTVEDDDHRAFHCSSTTITTTSGEELKWETERNIWLAHLEKELDL